MVGTKGVIKWAWDSDDELALSLVTEDVIESLPYEHTGHHQAIEMMANDFSCTLQGVSDWPESLATGRDGLIAQRIVDEALKACLQA